MKRPPPDGTLAVMSRADRERAKERELAPHTQRGVDRHIVVPRARGPLRHSSEAAASTRPWTRRLRRLAAWLSVLLADDGLSGRFVAERQRDEDLVRRVERRRRF